MASRSAVRGSETSMTRQFERKPLDVRLTVEGESLDGRVWFSTGDLSFGGAYLVSSFLFEVGTRVVLQLPIPGTPDDIELVGMVRWVNLGLDDSMAGRSPGMGIEFLDIDSSSRERLSAFLGG